MDIAASRICFTTNSIITSRYHVGIRKDLVSHSSGISLYSAQFSSRTISLAAHLRRISRKLAEGQRWGRRAMLGWPFSSGITSLPTCSTPKVHLPRLKRHKGLVRVKRRRKKEHEE